MYLALCPLWYRLLGGSGVLADYVIVTEGQQRSEGGGIALEIQSDESQ